MTRDCEKMGEMEENPRNTGIHFMQGNEACAEAALAVGCKFFAGYPITPASEILEILSKRLPRVGGVALQMEDEIASLSAVIGASWTGNKAMTATSGPGFSLMQESIGFAFMTETPCVVVDVQRAGPSTGQATKCAQGDVMQARWGTHGDYTSIVLSPNSVQEMFDFTVRAFNLSEQYRTPVILLTDEVVAHMREQIFIPKTGKIEIANRKKALSGEKSFFGNSDVPPMPSFGEGFNVAVTGSTHDPKGLRFTSDADVHRKLVERLVQKIEGNNDELAGYEAFNLENCDACIICYGCTSRAVYDAIELSEERGLKIGFFRLKTLWPFPANAVLKLAKNVKLVVVPEMNLKQLFYEVQRAVNGVTPVLAVNKIGGGEMITPEELVTKVDRGLENVG